MIDVSGLIGRRCADNRIDDSEFDLIVVGFGIADDGLREILTEDGDGHLEWMPLDRCHMDPQSWQPIVTAVIQASGQQTPRNL